MEGFARSLGSSERVWEVEADEGAGIGGVWDAMVRIDGWVIELVGKSAYIGE